MTKGRSLLLALTAAVVAAPVSAQSYYSPEAGDAALPGFGRTITAVGDRLLIGEPANQIRPGTVYIYGQDMGSWVEMGQLQAMEATGGDGFGGQVVASGDHLMISSSMGVHHFHRSGDTWTERGMITPSMAMEDADFGASIAMEGDYLLVGAPGANDAAGAAYLFHFDAGWNEVGMIAPDDIESNDAFGANIVVRNGLAAIAAPQKNTRRGAVYMYDFGMDGFSMRGMMEADGVRANARFGSTIWMGDLPNVQNIVLVAAPNDDRARGSVRLFVENQGEYVEGARLSAYDPQPGSGFGSSMASTGDGFLIGAPGASGSGIVYHFQMDDDGLMSTVQKMRPGYDGTAGFGDAIELGDGFWAIGAGRGDGRVVIYDGADMSSILLESEGEAYASITGNDEDIRCSGNAASEWECEQVDLVSFLSVEDLSVDGTRGINTNDNWGWTDPDTGKEYALVGMSDRASFVDISDPYNPVVLGILPMTEGANQSAWRDIKVYMNHAYIVSDGSGQHGMQVFDLTRLRDFDGTPQVFDEDALYTNVASVHNIVINEESGFAYAVGSGGGGETCGGGLHMIDIRDPKNPTFAGCFADPETGRASTGYSHDAQCVNYIGPDSDYEGREICIGSNETAISIADVTDKDNPVAVSRAAYPNPGYTHQGWFTPDHRFLYVNDELDELSGIVDRTRTIIWDLTDLDDPQLVAEHLGTQESSDHNLYIEGDLMYQSNYQSGLRILDISDRANPVEVAYFDTVPYGDNGAGFGGSWSNYPYFQSGVVIVTSGAEGLFMVRPTVRRTVF